MKATRDLKTRARGYFALLMTLSTVAALAPPGAHATAPAPAVFQVGADVEDITPTAAQGFPDAKGMWMGGYGLGAASRKSTGADPLGIHVRAMVVSNEAGDTLAFAINETQGMFAAYQQCTCGLDDMRKEINSQTGIPLQHIVLGSDHSHGGPDTTGVWGGVPATYLNFVKDQVVRAVVTAYNNRVPATINVGSAQVPVSSYGGDTLSIPGSPEQLIVDRTVRVLQAKRTSDSTPVITFIEAPFHPTNYCNSSCTILHPSWPGVVSKLAADQFGGVGMAWQGDIGRQPSTGGDTIYTAAQAAITAATPITDSTVAGKVQLILTEVTNPVYIWFLNGAYYAGTLPGGGTCTTGASAGGLSACSPVGRANTPPYGFGAAGTFWATSFRIGSVLFSGGPGEVYPNLQDQIIHTVDASQHFYLGLAQDQVGYIIGPTSSWAQVVGVRDSTGNDNGLFNAGPTLGDHLTCTQINGAAALGFTVTNKPSYCDLVTATDPATAQIAERYGLS